MTRRSFIVGALLCAFLSFAEPYSTLYNHSTGFCADFICAGAVVLLVLLAGLLNASLRGLSPRIALRREELLVVFIMLIVACAIPTWGLTSNLLPIMSGLGYYATETNEWARLIQPHVPAWLYPQGEEVNLHFFRGLPEGAPIPWDAWWRPLAVWCAFLFTLYFVMICLANLFRKQWVDNERLIFPLNALPVAMTEESPPSTGMMPFFRNRLMGLGFLIAFLLMGYNGLAHYFPFYEPLQFAKGFQFLRKTTDLQVVLSFPILGFTYFVNLDVALSFWLFHLLYRGFYGLWCITGFGVEGVSEPFMDTSPSASHMGMGGMIVLVGVGLYRARRHLKDSWLKAWKGPSPGDAEHEMLSYRTTYLGLLAGGLFLWGWCVATGMSWWLAPLFLSTCFVVFVGLTRIIAEGGFGFGRAMCTPVAFMSFAFPTDWLGARNLVSLGGHWAYAADIRTTVLTSAMHGLKLSDTASIRKRSLFSCVAAAVIISVVGSILTTLWMSYRFGGSTMQNFGWFFTGMPQTTWGTIEQKLRHGFTFSMVMERWLWTVLGGAFMFFLMTMRHRFLWWPLHYLGFPIADTHVIKNAWFSVMLGWLLKSVLLKYGGIRLYRKMKPLFLGAILGQLMAAFFWAVVAAVLNERTFVPIWIGVP